jgi:hypothetical protein
MRDAGFDMSVFDKYSSEVQAEARKLSIKKALQSLRYNFEDKTSYPLGEIKRGIYVIRLSGSMSIKYQKGNSPILYIGQGNVENRIKGHYQTKLFDFMLSLKGADFDFFVCEPWKSHYRNNDFHKQIEFEMLSDFVENYGGISDRYCFPLMNKISGSNRNLESGERWWRKPLKRSGEKIDWILTPGPNSEFVGSLD